ncbi:ABC transporter substrate-binding protein [Paenibacillus sp. N1-5-1-14]|uniref:ABC transporter substrate-binding protein n=1 Tax=Paenibacillus radicibacter TaxID=2972488 RepID=UPI002158D72D|nr:ABC transporter substrate-binding protein [Paenibacillus radicibacter]MCR8643167.1 ABC transporter substrate-binding protein [Paenibacillus radicibacter]
MRKVVGTVLASMMLLTGCSGGGKTSGEEKTVSISVMQADSFLKNAAAKFQEANPNIKIEIKEHMATNTAGEGAMSEAISQADLEKYVQTVSTQAMSGKGSDIIMMQSLPQDKFVDKKLLVNLYDLMKKDTSFDQNQYYTNILKHSQNGDGLYAMPFNFTLEAISGNTDLLSKANITIKDDTWTWEQFREISKKLREQKGKDYFAFINVFPNQLMAEYVADNYGELVKDGKGNFDTDLFRDMMRQIKSLYDEEVLQAEFTYDYSKALFAKSGLYDVQSALMMMLTPDSKLFQKPTANGKSSGGVFQTYLTLGINSKSKVQDEAWQFMKFLLSDEMQSSPELKSLPISKSVLENMLKEQQEQINNGILKMPKGKPSKEQVADAIAAMDKLIAGAGNKSTGDMKVQSIAMEEFESYMSGQKSAEEVSKLIQNRVNTYLGE